MCPKPAGRRLESANVRLLADLFHMNIEEADLPEAIRAAGPVSTIEDPEVVRRLRDLVSLSSVVSIAAFAGVVASFYVAYFWPSLGDGYMLSTLASVFLGGTSVFGGTGTILGTFLGAFIIGAIEAVPHRVERKVCGAGGLPVAHHLDPYVRVAIPVSQAGFDAKTLPAAAVGL